MTRIHCGTFEAEACWREPDLAALPSLPDRAGASIVDAMDELLFAFCAPGDRLLTRRPLDDAFADYLFSLGFRFGRNRFEVRTGPPGSGDGPRAANVFEALAGEFAPPELGEFLAGGGRFEPFAVVPGLEEATARYGLAGRFPSGAAVREVNAKSYSVRMREKLGIPNPAVFVESAERLAREGEELLRRGPFLIKDDYGVSGKGNLLVDSGRTLARITEYLARQGRSGKRIRFVLEPLLPRESDFSCQFRIGEAGEFELLSVQRLSNEGFAFGGSHTAGGDLLRRLEDSGYFPLMEEIGRNLHADGYFGDVCVDSMTLRSGEVAPLVEINARKSMSLIKCYADRYLAAGGMTGSLLPLTLVHDGSVGFAELLERFDAAGLLYRGDGREGVMPLTAGTLYADADRDRREAAGPAPGAGGRPFKGRWYVAVASDRPERLAELSAGAAKLLQQAGFERKG